MSDAFLTLRCTGFGRYEVEPEGDHFAVVTNYDMETDTSGRFVLQTGTLDDCLTYVSNLFNRFRAFRARTAVVA
jgi:hypothetical protein